MNQPEQVIAALRFDPLLPVWLLAALGVLVALLVVARACGGRAAGPCCVAGRSRC